MGGIVYGLFLLVLFPGGVPALNDDFGYYRSVIQTLQHGRPWTDDWLEPWSASFAGISAVLFRLTHSFYLCTYGFLALLGAVSFWASVSLFRARAFHPTAALASSALLLTFPTLLWKSIEFTGVALYLPCLLGALLYAERKNWGGFTAFWLIALASRQSAAVWGVLPAAELVRLIYKPNSGRGEKLWSSGSALLSGLALVALLKFGMNKTYAQSVKTDLLFAHWPHLGALKIVVLGLGIFLCSAGLSRYLVQPARSETENPATLRGVMIAGGLAALAYFIIQPLLPFLQVEHRLFSEPVSGCYLFILLALAIAGWLGRGLALRSDYLLTALASLILVSTRDQVWDYYYIDVGILGLFATTSGAVDSENIKANRLRAIIPLALLGGCSLIFVLAMKGTLDRGWALCDVTEKALRAGKMTRAELSFAPFGYAGWHLYPYSIAPERTKETTLDGFGRYFIPGAVEVGQGYSKLLHLFPRFRHEPPGDRTHLIASGEYRYLWLFRAKFFLLRFHTEQDAPPRTSLPTADKDFSLFPLNDGEWSQLIQELPTSR